MYSHRLSTLLATMIVIVGVSPSLGRPICRPHLAVKDVRLSELRNLERTWTAALNVNAASCNTDSGRFEILFVREKENAPELEFSATFTWHAGELGIGQTEASIDLWVDEVVHDYRVYTAPCACRD